MYSEFTQGMYSFCSLFLAAKGWCLGLGPAPQNLSRVARLGPHLRSRGGFGDSRHCSWAWGIEPKKLRVAPSNHMGPDMGVGMQHRCVAPLSLSFSPNMLAGGK